MFKWNHAILTYMITYVGDSGKETGSIPDSDGNTPVHYCCDSGWK